MTPLARAIASWRSLPDPIRFSVREALRHKAAVADDVADDESCGFTKDWRAEARALRVAMRLLKAAEKQDGCQPLTPLGISIPRGSELGKKIGRAIASAKRRERRPGKKKARRK